MSAGAVHVIDHPLVRVRLSAIRNVETPPAAFRRGVREISALMLPEITRDFATEESRVRTPLEECAADRLECPVVIAPILRAGLGMAEGMLRVLSDASVGHIGMFRDEETLKPQAYYFKMPPNLAAAQVIVVDPMLATGWSATAAMDQLKKSGAVNIRFACLLTCPEGIRQLHSAHPDVAIYTTVIDRQLNERGYIMPGLGDAGDRYFGTQIPS